MSINIKDKLDGWNKIKEKLNTLRKTEITIGVHKDAGVKREVKKVLGVIERNISDYAWDNEFGGVIVDVENNYGQVRKIPVPARPFLRQTTDNKDYWIKEIDKAYTNIINNDADINREISKVGEQAVQDVKATIDSDMEPRNSLFVQEMKGHGHTLIHTGLMRAAVKYKIKKI